MARAEARRAQAVAQIHLRAHFLKLAGKRLRRRRIPRRRQPVAIQAAYLGMLLATLRPLFKAVRTKMLEALPELLARADAPRRLDSWQDDLSELLDNAAVQLGEDDLEEAAAEAARTAARRTSAQNRDDLRRQFEAAIGVDPLQAAEPWLADEVDGFTRANVDLIKSVRRKYLDEVRSTVMAGVRTGRRHEDIAKALQAREGVAESSAALIARDQVLKFYADLNETRQQAAGVERYVWRTAGDGRVRDEHFELNGRTFRWDDPPPSIRVAGGGLEPGHPGEAVQCRCTAEPVVEDILAQLRAGEE